MTGILCTAFWVPFRAIHTFRCCPHPESFSVILNCMGYMLDFVIDLVEERVDLADFLNNSRTLVLYACFTTECGSPRIRKSMSASFTIILSWLKQSWSMTGLSVFSRSVLFPTLNVSPSWTKTCLRTIWHILCVCFCNGSPRSLMCLDKIGILTVLGLHSFQ